MDPQYLGVAGVSLLLLAFALNLIKKLHETHPAYLIMNVLGAGFAAVYAWASNAIPFVVLEVVWGGFAAIRLVQVLIARSNPSSS